MPGQQHQTPAAAHSCALRARTTSLRERKRTRTRETLVNVALDLFDRQGYDETTLAEIADAADIAPRTFFSYFASKEEIVFPDSATWMQVVTDTIAARQADDRPVDLLLRALGNAADLDTGAVGRTAAVRLRLIMEVPTVRGRGLMIQFAAQREIAQRLHEAFPEQLDELTAAALVGATVGSITATLATLFDDPVRFAAMLSDNPDWLRAELRRGAEIALRPWRP